MQPEYFTLPGGLRLVCEKIQSRVDCFGVAINAGSRDEAPHLHGLAHFVEHTIFKGTSRRRAAHIRNRMETVGGELNAFTTKEETNVYTVFPHGNVARAVELIADLVCNSIFPPHEIDRERIVVREEIDSYLDSPADAVFDDFENLFFRNSQLGHNILGDRDNLSAFTRQTCREWITSHYTPSRMTLFYRGSMSPARVRDIASRHFTSLPPDNPDHTRVAPPVIAPFGESRDIGSHQAHTVIGARVPSLFSPERYPLGLITNILGGPGMNSRLNIALRERRGLVYTVDASLSLLSDCGMFAVYFGCDPADNNRCIDLVHAELHRIATEPLSTRALDAAKKQYLGQLIVASDNNEQMALSNGRSTLFFGSVTSPADVRHAILTLTPDHIMQAARHIAPALTSRLTLT